MTNNNLIEVPKLGFINRIKKFFLIRRIDGTRYLKAPEVLKNDHEVVSSLMSKSHENLRFLSQENGLAYLEKHPRELSFSPRELRDKYVALNPELFKGLTKSQQIEYIFTNKKYEFFRELPKEIQTDILSGKKLYISIDDNSSNLRSLNLQIINSEGAINATIEPNLSFFYDKMNYFDEDVLIDLITKLSQDYDERYSKLEYEDERKRRYLKAKDFYDRVKLDNLPVETQIKIALLDNRLIKRMGIDAIKQFVGDNPLLFDMLPSDKKVELIKINPNFIKMLDNNEERERIYRFFPEYSKYLSAERSSFQRLSGLDYDETIKIAILGTDSYYTLGNITNSVKDANTLWEVSKTIPQALTSEKYFYIHQLLVEKISNPKIKQFIESQGLQRLIQDKRIEVQMAVYKVLTDEKVLSRCNEDIIIEFIKNPSMDILKDIVGETYGEQARRILDSRPELSFDNIPNLRIFDEEIFKNFGEGVIHNQLSYDTKFSILLADMANNPEKIENYKKFERLTDGLFTDTIAGNEQRFKAYMEFSDLIYSIDEGEMNQSRINALKLAIADVDLPEMRLIKLHTIDDLDSYIERRNAIYDDAISKTTDVVAIKDILSRKIFGMKYTSVIDSHYKASNLSLNGMLHYYSIDNFLSDKRTHESDLFSENELDMLELAQIIDRIDDPHVLKELYEALSEKEDILSPVEFEIIKQKIPVQYSRELISQLMTPERAYEMIERGEDGISVEHGEDGIDLIKLQGADFKLMVHTMMGIDGQGSNSMLSIPFHKSPDEIWKYFENGCSIISTCLLDPDILKGCGSNDTFLHVGFCSLDPRLIIGMSHRDAQASHLVGDPDPGFSYGAMSMNYPEELLRKTAAQIVGIEKKDFKHDYNEVTAFRRVQDLDSISSENLAGRVLPDYIIVFGEPNDSHRELAKAFSRDGKPIPIIEIDTEYYRGNMNLRAMEQDEEHKMPERKKSKFINSIEDIVDDREER